MRKNSQKRESQSLPTLLSNDLFNDPITELKHLQCLRGPPPLRAPCTHYTRKLHGTLCGVTRVV